MIVLIIALLIARSVMKKKGIRLFKRKPKKLNIDDGFGILSSAEEKAAEDTEEVAEEVEEAAAEVSSSEIEAEDAEETEADEASEDEEKEGE